MKKIVENIFELNRFYKILIQLMIDFPKLIERPIVIFDNEAVVARPLENLIVWTQKKIKNAN